MIDRNVLLTTWRDEIAGELTEAEKELSDGRLAHAAAIQAAAESAATAALLGHLEADLVGPPAHPSAPRPGLAFALDQRLRPLQQSRAAADVIRTLSIVETLERRIADYQEALAQIGQVLNPAPVVVISLAPGAPAVEPGLAEETSIEFPGGAPAAAPAR